MKAAPMNFEIDGFSGIKSIFEFDEKGRNVAVVSHPGWKSHHRNQDRFYSEMRKLIFEDAKPDFDCTGIVRARHSALFMMESSPDTYLNGRQIAMEEELFLYLKHEDIPTIVTVPVKPYSERDDETVIGEMMKNPDEMLKIVLSNQKFCLSPVMSKDFPSYLRDVSGGRENFYFVPTDYESDDDKTGCTRGFIYGDYAYRGLELEVVSAFLRAVSGKRVFFAGSNFRGCAEQTLGYFGYTDCKVGVLVNYCGLAKNEMKKIGPIELSDFDGDLQRSVRNNPKEREIREKLGRIFSEMLINVRKYISHNDHHKPINADNIKKYEKYLLDY